MVRKLFFLTFFVNALLFASVDTEILPCPVLLDQVDENPLVENDKRVPLSDRLSTTFPYHAGQILPGHVRTQFGPLHRGALQTLATRVARAIDPDAVHVITPDGANFKYSGKRMNAILIAQESRLIALMRLGDSTSEAFHRLAGFEQGPYELRTRLFGPIALEPEAGFSRETARKKFEAHRFEFNPPMETVEEYEEEALKFLRSVSPYQLIIVQRYRSATNGSLVGKIIKIDLETREYAVLRTDEDKLHQRSRLVSYYRRRLLEGFIANAFDRDQNDLSKEPH